MKFKTILKISVVLILLLIFTNSIVYALSVEASAEWSWVETRKINVINLSLIAMVITISVELIIARFMNIKNYKIIFVTNFVTQLFLHINTINCFSYNTYDYEWIIIVFLEFIIWFVEFLIYTMLIPECSKKKIFTYVMIANIVTFIAPYIILYNTYTSPLYYTSYYDGTNIITLSITYINFIIIIMYIISFIATLILDQKVSKLKKQEEIYNEEKSVSLRKKLLLLEITTILLAITTFNNFISTYYLGYEFGILITFISILIITKIFVHRLKMEKLF